MNNDQTTEQFDVVMENPAIYYNHPSEIIDDPRLTTLERLRLLDEWNMDISQKLSADEEGMTPADARDSANDAVILEQIAHTKTIIENREPVNEGIFAAIERVWHRL